MVQKHPNDSGRAFRFRRCGGLLQDAQATVMGGTPLMKLIEPPHAHVVFALLPSAGKPAGPTLTVEEPGLHGATVIGRHGIGVSTPRAAAVAAAT